MEVRFRVREGMRSMSVNFYRQKSCWFDRDNDENSKEAYYYWDNMTLHPISHKDLAEDIEILWQPHRKFIEYLNRCDSGHSVYRRMEGNNISDIFFGELLEPIVRTPIQFRKAVEVAIQKSWRYWLSNNLGNIVTGNKRNTPLVDTKQYMTNLDFEVSFGSQEKQILDYVFKRKLTPSEREEYIDILLATLDNPIKAYGDEVSMSNVF